MKKGIRTALKVLLWVLAGILALVLAAGILVQIPAVQDLARRKAVSFLQDKLETRVEIGRIRLRFPGTLLMENLYLEDRQQDTLLAAGAFFVDLSLPRLLRNEVLINEIRVERFRSSIYRSLPDSSFNFDFIIDAFTGPDTLPQENADTTALKISLGRINLEDIRFSYRDETAGTGAELSLGALRTRVRESDVDRIRFSFAPTEVENARVAYLDSAGGMETRFLLGKLDLAPFRFDLPAMQVILEEVKLEDSEASVLFRKTEQEAAAAAAGPETAAAGRAAQGTTTAGGPDRAGGSGAATGQTGSQSFAGPADPATGLAGAEPAAPDTAGSWEVRLGNLLVSNTAFRFDDENAPRQAEGMDYMHLAVEGFETRLRDLTYSGEGISGRLEHAAFRESSGFTLKELRAGFAYSDVGASLEDFYLETPGTVLRDRVLIGYPSLEAVSEDPGRLSLDVNLTGSRVSYADMLLLAPFLDEYEPFHSTPEGFLEIDGTVSGKLNDLAIKGLEISTLEQTHLAASARVKGLPDMEKAWFDIQLDELRSAGRDMQRLAGPGMLPPDIRLPAELRLEAAFRGSLRDFTARAALGTSYGSMNVAGSMQPGINEEEGRERYAASLELREFDLGRLLRQEDTIGTVSLSAVLEGSGTETETADASFRGVLQKAVYNGYEYKGLEIEGRMANRRATVLAGMRDPNLAFNLDAAADLSGEYPALKMDLRLDTLDLKALNLYEKELRMRTRILADLPTADPDHLNGSLAVSDLVLELDSGRYAIDTISLAATASDTLKTIDLASEFMTASVRGNFTPTLLGGALMAHAGRHFNKEAADSLVRAGTTVQELTASVRVFSPPVLNELLPELSLPDTIALDAAFDNRRDLLEVRALIPGLAYGSNELDSAGMIVHSADTGISYVVSVREFRNPALQLLHTRLEGGLANDRLDIHLSTRDAGLKERYRFSGALSASSDTLRFGFLPGGILLDYEEWEIPEDNLFFYSDSGYYVRNFRLSHQGQSLLLDSREPRPGAPLELSFDNFEIATLTRMAQQDSIAAGGKLNGSALLTPTDSSFVFTSDILINDFNFNADTVGNITLQVNNEQENTYAANVAIESDRNRLNLSGAYYPEPVGGNNFDLALDIINIDMATVEAFSFGQLSDASGGIKGSFDISGTMENPSVLGALTFSEAAFTATYINSYLLLEDETISLDREGIRFDEFTVLDSLHNRAVIDGRVYTTDFSGYRFDLSLNTSNFRAINTGPKDNELYYGQLYLDSDIHLGGDIDKPVVDAYVKVNEKTDFTLVLPSEEPGVQERQGVVEFVDLDAPPDTLQTDTLRAAAGISGLDVTANLEIDKEAQFTIIVDPVNGDNLKVKGSAALSTGIDPGGNISLTGRYEIVEGAYELSFNLIRRRFEIQKGSYITWVSDPFSADVDITATYIAETAPLELVQEQLSNMTQQEKNRFKQTLPFIVELHMEGELMKPQISFNIDLPEKERDAHEGIVYAKLQQLQMQGSELNKQVFALLVLNRFVAENPFESSGGGASSIARQSVSKLLSEQLNRLAGDLIAGVDLNFDLESTEDYSTGEKVNRTDLNVGLSKSLLNDRIKVNVGSSFGLEGQETRGQASTIAGDVSVDYQLSKDGRYLLRAYRKNEYEGVIEGQIIESGLSFIISLDYDQFKELFR